jgi:hypothetical protein
VARVVVSNPKIQAIAEAKVKTDQVDARPSPSCSPRLPTAGLVARRPGPMSVARNVASHASGPPAHHLRNQVHAVLARNFTSTCLVSDLFGNAGRL